MDSFDIIPSINSHITHSELSKVTAMGIEAHIFIDKPDDKEFENVLPNTVYLVTVDKGAMLRKFKAVRDEAFILPLAMYFEILTFFQHVWPVMKLEMEEKFKQIRRRNCPYEVTPAIHFYHNGTAYYERWFEDIFMHFKKASTDYTHGYFQLQRGSSSIHLDPEVMCELAKSREGLQCVLLRSGYNEVPAFFATQS